MLDYRLACGGLVLGEHAARDDAQERPYDPERKKPILYAAGEYLRFRPIDADEYRSIEQAVAEGTYEYETFVEEV